MAIKLGWWVGVIALAISFAGCTERTTPTDSAAAPANVSTSSNEGLDSRSGVTSEGSADLWDNGSQSGSSGGTEYTKEIVEKKVNTPSATPEAQ